MSLATIQWELFSELEQAKPDWFTPFFLWGNQLRPLVFLSLSNRYLTANKEIFVTIYDKWKIQTYQVYQSPVRVVSEPQKSVEDRALSAAVGAMICLGVLIGISSVILLFTLIR